MAEKAKLSKTEQYEEKKTNNLDKSQVNGQNIIRRNKKEVEK